MNVNHLSLVWLRRDLRLHDHAALYQALATPGVVQPVFIFDSEILGAFPNPEDRRLSFIASALRQIDATLKQRGGGLLVLHGKASEIITQLTEVLGAAQVFAAEDFEPATIARDNNVQQALGNKFQRICDHLIFSPREILREGKSMYKVFTPYSRAWLAQLTPLSSAPYDIKDQGRYADCDALRKKATAAGLNLVPLDLMLASIGYKEVPLPEWSVRDVATRIENFIATKVARYPQTRDIPGVEGTSRLSPYLRFGLVSVRELLRAAQQHGHADKWISELIWREFYAAILFHYPESQTQELQPHYRGTLKWNYDEARLAAWKEGRTGYPIIDAAMRELLTTGWMHNRARMIVASFLTKDLLLDWRLGEAHFAQYLMDYELASNVGGWQWAASTGTDAQPWFRIFNPTLQSKKFDPCGDYIRTYVSEIAHLSDTEIHTPWLKAKPAGYPTPIVDHEQMRKEALAMFKAASSS